MHERRLFNTARRGTGFELEEILEKDRRKSIFREIGREILRDDTGDNAVKIMRAMERAFQAGIATRDEERSGSIAIAKAQPRRLEMIDFPSRARGVLEFMAVRHMHDMPNALVYSNDHWSIYQFGPDPQIWKPATLTGLIKHRILVELDPIKGRPILALSTKGVELILNGSVAHDVRAESTVHFRIVSYSAPSSPGTETT